MADPGEILYDSLDSYEKLQDLVDNGEAEGLHLECKAPAEPKLTRDLRAKLAEAASGFSNTSGGVIVWGASTTKHSHSGLDIISQLEPVGNIRKLAQQIERAVPTLTTPPITTSRTRVFVDALGSSRGIAVTYLPASTGDPVQSNSDQLFHFRNGDEFAVLPYSMLQRLFAASETPELEPRVSADIVKLEPDGTWDLPIVLDNRSSAVAEHVTVLVEILNPSACSAVIATAFKDTSASNPGRRVFSKEHQGVIHRGLTQVVGNIRVKMKVEKRAKRALRVEILIFANRMRARVWEMTVTLAKKGFSVSGVASKFLY